MKSGNRVKSENVGTFLFFNEDRKNGQANICKCITIQSTNLVFKSTVSCSASAVSTVRL